MKSFKLYNGKRDKFSLRKKSVGLVSVAIATLAMYGIVGGSQTVQAEEQKSTNSQVTSVSDSSEKTETEKAVVPTPISEDASPVSNSSVSENEIMDAAQSVSGLQSSSIESTSSEDSSASSSSSSSTEEESSKPSPTPSQSETTPKTEETNTAPQTRAARSRRSVTETISQISDFQVTVTTRDGKELSSGSTENLTGQDVELSKISMSFSLTQDGTLTKGKQIRIPVSLENNSYASYYSNLSSGTTETIPGVGTIRFDFSNPNNLAYVITIGDEFATVPNGSQKTISITQNSAADAKFTAKSSYKNIVLTINGSTFTFKPKSRTFEKAQAPFAVYHNISTDAANSIKIGTSTGDANYYNNMLSSDGQTPGNTNIPTGDIITIHRIKPENGSKIIKISPEPHRITSTLAISEDGKYLVKNDTPRSIPITAEKENKLITDLPANSTDEDILKALKKAGKNSSVVIDNGDGTYTVATNLGKMIGEGATTYHDIWPTDNYAQYGDQFQEIDRTEEVNKKVSEILKNMSVIQGTAHSTRITFADSSINNTITSDSKSYSVNDDGSVSPALRKETITKTTTPSQARSEGQTKITVQYVDTAGNQIATQTYQYGYPAGALKPQSPNYTAKPQSIPGYTLITTSQSIPSMQGTQLTGNQSIAFNSSDQVFYYVYAVNKSNAKVTYIDDTDENKVLETKELTGDYNTTDSYRTKDTIESYEKKGYELVSDNYPSNGVTYNEKTQEFEVHLKHKTKTETQTKTVKETIKYIYAKDGTKAASDYTTELKFTRTATTDLVTNVTTGDWTAINGNTFAEVVSPKIPGYTPDWEKVQAFPNITGDSKDIVETVVYSADKQKVTYTVIDDTANKTLKDKVELTTGDSGATLPSDTEAKYDQIVKDYLDQGYELVSKSPLPPKFDTDSSVDQNVEIHLKHKVTTSKENKTVKETINYIYEKDGTTAAPERKATLKFTREVKTDEVTKVATKGAWTPAQDTFAEVVSPTIAGYTPDKAKVEAVQNVTADHADINVTVTYKADKQKVTYTVIDETTNTTLEDKVELTTGDSGAYLPADAQTKYDKVVADYLAKGYELAHKDNLPAQFDTDSKVDQNVVIRLKHKTAPTEETKTVTETIKYVYENGNEAAATKVQKLDFKRTNTKDLVTGKVITEGAWTPAKGTFAEVISPTIAGYTADKAKVEAKTVTANHDDINITVTYKADKQKVTYTIIDDTTHTTLKNKVELTTGDSGANLPADVQTKYDKAVDDYLAKGYELVSKDELPTQFDTDSSVDQNVVVHLKHKVITSTEKKTVTETIHYVYKDGSQAAESHKATLDFAREVRTDEVTKAVTKGAWSPSTSTFAAVTSPIIAGYTADKPVVEAVDGIIGDSKDVVVKVTYTADKQKVTYTVIDETTQKTLENQVELTTGDSDSALPTTAKTKYDQIVKGYTDKGYELISKDDLPAKFDKDSTKDQNVVIRLKHSTTDNKESKKVSLTVRYHGAGSQTPANNVQTATWTRTVTKDKVTGDVVKTTDWTADKVNYNAVPSPVIPGYTVDVATVAAEKVTQEDIVKDVHYGIQTQKVTYTVIDDTTGTTLENQVELTTGHSGTNLPTDAQTKYDRIVKGYTDKGYKLVSKDDLPAQFDKDSSVDQNVVVHLKHKVTTSSEIKTVKETIHYVYQNGSEARSSYGTSLSFTREVKTDEVTKRSTKGAWSPVTGTFAAVTSPTITGYTADKPIVAAVEGITGDSDDIEKTVVYTANQEKAQVRYIDDTTGATLETKELTGDYNTTDSYRTADTISHYTSQGYELVSDNYPSNGVTYNTTYQKFEVHLRHKTAPVEETKTVTEAIKYVYENGDQAATPKVQKLDFKRTNTKDLVTGKISQEGVWAPSTGTFSEVVSPTVDGYTPDKSKVDAVTITAAHSDIHVTVTYKADKQKVTYTVVDDTAHKTLKDKEVLTSGDSDTPLSDSTRAKYDSIVNAYLAQGYELVSKDPLPAKFDLDSSHDQNVTVHLKHGTTDIQESELDSSLSWSG